MNVAGKLLIDFTGLTADDRVQAAGLVDSLPAGATVELLVDCPLDPVATGMLWQFGRHLRYIVTSADPRFIASWMRGIQDEQDLGDPGADHLGDPGAGSLRLVTS